MALDMNRTMAFAMRNNILAPENKKAIDIPEPADIEKWVLEDIEKYKQD